MKWVLGGLTHRGCRRQTNQDAIDWLAEADGREALALLADGMGGYAGGEIASQLAVETARTELSPLLAMGELMASSVDRALLEAFDRANRGIIEAREANANLARMGTTLVAVMVLDERAFIAHVGDSRCYLHNDRGLTQITRDDSLVQRMIDDGSIDPAEAERVPFRNVLTKALGAESYVPPSCHQLALAAGDRLILCSDGLPGAVPESEWEALLAGADGPQKQAEALVAAALVNQADDNVSVIIIECVK